jgi:hypothetical protein
VHRLVADAERDVVQLDREFCGLQGLNVTQGERADPRIRARDRPLGRQRNRVEHALARVRSGAQLVAKVIRGEEHGALPRLTEARGALGSAGRG